MSEGSHFEPQLPINLLNALDDCLALVDDTIDKEKNMLAANQENYELESRFAAELKLNTELKERLEKVKKNSNHLDKMCSMFKSVNIKENDQTRLNNAQEMLRIAKEYTGIRWDYTAPLDVAKGYVKNSRKMLLECFEYKLDAKDSASAVAALWKYVASAARADWQDLVTGRVVDKENVKNN